MSIIGTFADYFFPLDGKALVLIQPPPNFPEPIVDTNVEIDEDLKALLHFIRKTANEPQKDGSTVNEVGL